MSWFSTVFQRAKAVVVKAGEDYVYAEMTSKNGVPAPSEPVEKDLDYVTVTVRASRIVNVRKGFGKFYASVQSRAHYLHLNGEIEYQKVLVPEMKELDAANVDRVIVIDKPILGPVPYIGGLSLEIGLFSVKGSDLAAPYLDLLSSMATISGVAALGVALPYVEPLRKGADLLFGNSDLSSLEIGLDTAWKEVSTGTWLLIRAPRDKLNLDDLRVNPSDGKVTDSDGKPHRTYPYLVFSIERSRRRDDWMKIPELKTAWDAVATAAQAGKTNDAEQLLRQFALIAKLSPDLVPDDAKRLVAKANDKFTTIQPVAAVSRTEMAFPRFEDLNLYDD